MFQHGDWSLRSHLSALLVVTMLVTFSLVGGGMLAWRLPAVNANSRIELADELAALTERVVHSLDSLRFRLDFMAQGLRRTPADLMESILLGGLGNGDAFHAIYLVSPGGRVRGAALAPALQAVARDLVGSDLASNPLYQAASRDGQTVWSGKYLSPLTGMVTAGVAYRFGQDVLIGEVPMVYLLQTVARAAGRGASSIWVVDRTGEVIADTDGGRQVGQHNLLNWPVMQAALAGQPPPAQLEFGGLRRHVAVAHSEALHWYFIGTVPAGMDNPRVARTVAGTLAAFAGCIVMGLLIAPFWARRMARPLRKIVERASQITAGQLQDQAWPRGTVTEFKLLSADLEKMALTLRERERTSLAIFNASPVPMAVADAAQPGRIVDVNEAWCRTFLHRREDVVGRDGQELGLLRSESDRAVLALAAGDQSACVEVELLRSDGQPVLAQVFSRSIVLESQQRTIWATVDIGPMRRVEQALRELNQQLEARVHQRTHALAVSNAELSSTVERLQLTQAELVRTEKMAALGGLVAGVAHELNTPLGNGVMATSAMADATRLFQSAMQAGLLRADLQRFVDSIAQGTDIAGRNLRRAAELVHSFKQVAVDQTSDQRRSFEVMEVLHEILVSLQPSFSRTPYRFEVDVPATGLVLDSYPGALGQAMANLVQNAVLHGFDGRAHGTVRITAARVDGQRIEIRVADDGKGIPQALVGRIFEPFVTTRMGRGGTGLGLHVSYNAVVHLLGGTLTVQSEEGRGSCFTLDLPVQAPQAQGGAL